MIIIETCPVCGSDLVETMLCGLPPVPRKDCSNPQCGWSWIGKPVEIMRVPFQPEEDEHVNQTL